MSLRAELIGTNGALPAFALLLPDGWTSGTGDLGEMHDAVEASLVALPATSRAAVRSSLRILLEDAAERATRAEIIRVFTQSDVSADSYVPMSIVASWLRSPGSRSIQDLGAQLIRTRNAGLLDPDGTILRWTEDGKVPVDDGTVEVHGINYMLAVPGHPAVGLVLRTSILRGADGVAVDDEPMAAMTMLSDSIVSTVRWRRDA